MTTSPIDYKRWSVKGRSNFDGPVHMRRDRATYYVTGDQESGLVGGWFYYSGDNLHQILVELPSQHGWRWSPTFRPVSHADTVYIVLDGTFMMTNPETGEVQRAVAGEAVFFRPRTWYLGLNIGDRPLRLLEYVGPEQVGGSKGAPDDTLLSDPKFSQDRWVNRWPMDQVEAEASFELRVLREADLLWRMEEPDGRIPVGIVVSTETLTVGEVRLLPGQNCAVHIHGGDEALYLPSGSIGVRIADLDGAQWSYLRAGDGYFIPAGRPHQYRNSGNVAVEFYFGVAPRYFSERNDIESRRANIEGR